MFADASGESILTAGVVIDTVPWGAWKSRHPDSRVLSRETGFERPYGHDPYSSGTIEDAVAGVRIRTVRDSAGR